MSSGRVLIVEDDARIADLLKRGLAARGIESAVAEDGALGREAWESGGFDLVLLDVMLPEIDGISLCAERRAAGDQTPVILLTAREEVDGRARGLAAGANYYLTKPFVYTELLSCISSELARHQTK